MYFATYDVLPQEAADLRCAVFMQEQGFASEFDETDSNAKHVVLYDDGGKAVGVCRYFWSAEKASYIVGRVAIAKQWRLKHLGAAVMGEAERQLAAKGETCLMLAAQLQAQPFYQRLGYSAVGGVFYDEHCPHIWMRKNLEANV